MKKAERVVDFAMKMELEARDFYLDSMERVSRADTRSLLATLAEWEKGHYDFLKQHKDSLEGTGKWGKVSAPAESLEEAAGIVLEKRTGTAVEPPLGETSSDFSVLRMAMAIETDFQNFYGNAARTMNDPEGRKILEMLSEWEGDHQEYINEQYGVLHREFMNEMGFEPF